VLGAAIIGLGFLIFGLIGAKGIGEKFQFGCYGSGCSYCSNSIRGITKLHDVVRRGVLYDIFYW